MKECPECGLVHADVISTCDCGYKFPAHHRKQCPNCGARWPDDFARCRDCGYQFFPIRKVSNGSSARERNLLFLIPTLAGLLLSCFWTALWGAVLMDPSGREYLFQKLVFLVVAVLIIGGSLRTLKMTSGWRHWTDLPPRDKRVAAMTIVAGLAEIAFTCLACYLLYLFGKGLEE